MIGGMETKVITLLHFLSLVLVYIATTYRFGGKIYIQHLMKGHLHLIFYILHFSNYILSRSTIYVILAKHKGLPEDDLLTSKYVGANHM